MKNNSGDRDYRSLMQNALQELKKMQSKLTALEQAKKEPIAVVSLGCRFPGGANDPEAFWQVLQTGVDATREVPKDRWDINTYYDPNPETPGKMYTRYASFLDQVDQFDPLFFGISPREAVAIDPQQRLLLEVSWESLERAGLSPDRLRGSQTGVFVGVMNNDYGQLIINADAGSIEKQYMAGGGVSSAAGRLAYFYGFHGPTLALDTACSSSLVAVHLACSSLRLGECSLALACGVNLILSPYTSIAESGARMLATDGRCKTFDAAADGFGRGEGCGVVVLKRLSDARRDGDPILAVIRGSAVNQDGRTSGLTVPNELAQERVICQALSNADVKPEQVSYIEAHGTGTSLGDPIEVGALSTVFGKNRPKDESLAIASLKTNMGHLEGAAGIAGLIKVVLQLQQQEIAPHLHFQQPSPHIPWGELPITVPTQPLPWKTGEKPRIAGVSAFSYVGTNAHVVLEEAPLANPPSKTHDPAQETLERPLHLLTLSAKSPEALQTLATDYHNHLKSHPELNLADICFTANTGRSQMKSRLGILASTVEELQQQLEALTTEEAATGVYRGTVKESTRSKIAFLFTGQGSQYIEMGQQLYATQPSFRQTLDHCDQILRPYLEIPLLEVLYPQPGQTSPLDQTAYTQPALFAIEYALCQLWQSWGVTPDVVLGHSVGEYVAACIAGVFSLEEGLKLIAHRGRLMQALPPEGEMVAILATPEQVQTAILPYQDVVSIAAYNGPQSVVISGQTEAINSICSSLDAEGIKTKRLQVSHAFHSPLMEPMLAEFEQVASEIRFQTPKIRIITNLTGKAATEEFASPQYWVQHIRQAVQFTESMTTLQQLNVPICVEMGPKPILLGMARQCLVEENRLWLPSLRTGVTEWQQLLESLAQLYVTGVEIDWSKFEQDYPRQKVILPTYPFERQRYWIETQTSSVANQIVNTSQDHLHPLLGQRLYLAGSKEIRFQSWLSPQSPQYLQDHRIYDQVILPGVAYLEMALMAARKVIPENVILSEVIFAQALPLSSHEGVTVQTVLTPDATGGYRFEIFSLQPEADSPTPSWVSHAAGTVVQAKQQHPASPVDLNDSLKLCQQVVDVKDYYQRCQQQNLDYGESFQTITQLWQGERRAVARIEIPSALMLQTADYQIHPVLLDASLQAVGAVFPADATETYLPVGIETLQVYQQSVTRLWCQVELSTVEASNQPTLTANVDLLDDNGVAIAKIEGLSLKRTSRAALQRLLQKETADWLYQIDWQPQPLTDSPATTAAISGNWLIFADSEGLGEQLSATLAEQGANCIVVTSANTYQKINPQHYQLDPSQLQQFQTLLNDAMGQQQLQGIIHLGSIQPTTPETTDFHQLELSNCFSVLHLVQALSQWDGESSPRLVLVTQGTQAVTDAPVQLGGSSLWGMARSIALEYPELQCQRIDLAPDATPESNLQALVSELAAVDVEDQIAIRGNLRYVARLVQHQTQSSDHAEIGNVSTDQPVELKLSEYGVLENLTLEPLKRRPPAANEVEIQVRATGLNFREVAVALGRLKEYYASAYNISSATQLTFGFECAGTIVALGDNVSHFQVGDEVVVGLATDATRSFMVVDSKFVVPKPKNLSFEEAATIPLVFLTAYYGLHELAKIQPGERVLIHAAAGGVGQAAVQLAQQVGAEVFATASPSKWEYLKSMGVQHVMNSRTLDFADEIMKLTQGEGVDIVLNSLSGEIITKSAEVLAQGGRFVEIGQLGDDSENQLKAIKTDISYFPLDLGVIKQQSPDALAAILLKLMDQFQQGHLKPLRQTIFPLKYVVDAFRYIAAAKHIGKVVISIPQIAASSDDSQLSIQSDGTYLITTGFGSLGLEVAQFLVERGAKYLALVGQQESSFEHSGTRVLVTQADISQSNEVAEVLQQIQSSMPPLKGIIHAAEVTDDSGLTQQSRERFQQVMAPQVAGAWNLHHFTQNLPLDFFICCSSAAAWLGSANPGNNTAAGAFMDAFAHYRRGMDLPGQSISWGRWSQESIAKPLEHTKPVGLTATALEAISPKQGVQILDDVLSSTVTQVAVLPINWSQFLATFSEGHYPCLLKNIVDQKRQQNQRDYFTQQPLNIVNQLQQSTTEDRESFVRTLIQELAAQGLGLKVSQLDVSDSLTHFGFDSLIAVELRNRISKKLGVEIPMVKFLENPTVNHLTAEVLTLLPQSDRPMENSVENLQTIDESSDSLPPELIPLQRQGSKTPLFFVHPLAGVVFPYYELATVLDSERPFYAFQSKGLLTEEKPLKSIEDMATAYIQALKKVQPSGPYYLGGWSLGAFIAWEMAVQLKDAGEEVAFLGVLDLVMSALSNKMTKTLFLFKFILTQMILFIWPYIYDFFEVKSFEQPSKPTDLEKTDSDHLVESDNSVFMKLESIYKVILQSLRRLWYRIPVAISLLLVVQANFQAVSRYIPRAYSGSMTLLRTHQSMGGSSEDQTLGWKELAKGGVQVHLVPGNHLNMLRKPYVMDLAEKLRDCLDQTPSNV